LNPNLAASSLAAALPSIAGQGRHGARVSALYTWPLRCCGVGLQRPRLISGCRATHACTSGRQKA
jgi:hypothetical protein